MHSSPTEIPLTKIELSLHLPKPLSKSPATIDDEKYFTNDKPTSNKNRAGLVKPVVKNHKQIPKKATLVTNRGAIIKSAPGVSTFHRTTDANTAANKRVKKKLALKAIQLREDFELGNLSKTEFDEQIALCAFTPKFIQHRDGFKSAGQEYRKQKAKKSASHAKLVNTAKSRGLAATSSKADILEHDRNNRTRSYKKGIDMIRTNFANKTIDEVTNISDFKKMNTPKVNVTKKSSVFVPKKKISNELIKGKSLAITALSKKKAKAQAINSFRYKEDFYDPDVNPDHDFFSEVIGLNYASGDIISESKETDIREIVRIYLEHLDYTPPVVAAVDFSICALIVYFYIVFINYVMDFYRAYYLRHIQSLKERLRVERELVWECTKNQGDIFAQYGMLHLVYQLQDRHCEYIKYSTYFNIRLRNEEIYPNIPQQLYNRVFIGRDEINECFFDTFCFDYDPITLPSYLLMEEIVSESAHDEKYQELCDMADNGGFAKQRVAVMNQHYKIIRGYMDDYLHDIPFIANTLTFFFQLYRALSVMDYAAAVYQFYSIFAAKMTSLDLIDDFIANTQSIWPARSEALAENFEMFIMSTETIFAGELLSSFKKTRSGMLFF